MSRNFSYIYGQTELFKQLQHTYCQSLRIYFLYNNNNDNNKYSNSLYHVCLSPYECLVSLLGRFSVNDTCKLKKQDITQVS